ncbi:MAG: AMP-binding protein, partial [bacterium]|nr:AMP-binding protein [bacterium]
TMVEHGGVVNLLSAMQTQFPLEEGDVYLLKTPYLFDVSVSELFGWFGGGGRLVQLEPGGEKDLQVLLASIYRHRISHINFVPSLFQALVEYLNMHPGQSNHLDTLKYIFLAGEELPSRLVEQFNQLQLEHPIALENLYGPTEAIVYSSRFSLSRWDGNSPVPIGKPLQNVRLYILDKNLNIQPIGVCGELFIAGDMLARGYLNQPGLTAERFTRIAIPLPGDEISAPGNEMYKTGDLAGWLPDGNIRFLGRSDHQVKVRGYRIELGEVENQLRNNETLKEAVVTAHRDKHGSNLLCAYIVPRIPGFDLTGLRNYLSRSLPDYMIPSHFMELEKLPLNASGKIDRKALPEPTREASEGYVAPRDAIEKKLVEIWMEILEIESSGTIGIDDNFFHLGGQSLTATVMVSKIHKTFNGKLTLNEIFQAPRIRELSQVIKNMPEARYVSLEPVEEREYYRLSSAQKRLYIIQQMETENIAYNIFSAFELEGNIDIERLNDTIKQLINRHEGFRSSFFMQGSEPVQKILTDTDFRVSSFEVKEKEENNVEQQVRGIIRDFIKPFRLDRPPLLRTALIKEMEDTHILIFDMHH